ncbi:MAG: C10 family peptidase [Bacteroidaceae bacterium]|nr:C10 family peptidase [Bacteroidaceae bacterium]
MKRNILLLLLLTLSLAAGAQRRTETEAEQVARRFLASQSRHYPRLCPASLSPRQAEQLEHLSQTRWEAALPEGLCRPSDEGQPFYIFNDEARGAFVIVSGDSRLRDVLGWSDEGVFGEGELPEGLADLLSIYARQWADAERIEEEYAYQKNLPRWGGQEVEPLLSTKWGQGTPYNALCPSEGRGTHTPAGCVATAMAQILKYYAYPERANGKHSFVSRTKGYSCSFNFTAATFDWDKMLDVYEQGSYSSAEANAVSELMYACGVSVDMDYEMGGSGAYSDDVPYALGHFFKCNPHMSRYMRDYFPPEDFDSLLYTELAARRPVLFCGARNDSSGHAYVIDGVDGAGLYHFNWGWSGARDGYYALDAQHPYDSRHYDFFHEAICRISPEPIGDLEQLFYLDTFSVERPVIAWGDTLRADLTTIMCANANLTHIDNSLYWEGLYGVGLYDELGRFVCWADIPDELQTNYDLLYYCWYMIVFPPDICLPGTRWSLKPCALPAGEEVPVTMHTLHALTDSIPVYVASDSIYVGVIPEEVTSVRFPQESSALRQAEGTFDLQGRPLREGSRGIVVSKGKKILVR